MPSFEDLISLLSGVRVTDRNRRRAYTVAGHLVSYTLKERWNELTKSQQQTLIIDSGNRLWAGYMKKRRIEYLSTKEAANEAVLEELAFLQRSL